jgi:hypothetical protein
MPNIRPMHLRIEVRSREAFPDPCLRERREKVVVTLADGL